MNVKKVFAWKWIAGSLLVLFLVVACGGGGGEGESAPNSSINGTISGTATDGPVSGATVTAWSMTANGTRGSQFGSAQTDGQGNFSMSVGGHSGPFMLQMSGGSYMDEATGSQMNMGNNIMTCLISQMSAGSTVSGIQITPLTSMAQMMAQNMSGGMNPTNMNAANHAMGNYFGVSDITMIHPMDPTVSGSGSAATQEMRNYGMTMAAMSQYAKDIGMPQSSGIITAMMNDASDGHMDGMMTGQGGTGMMSGQNGTGMMGSTLVEMGGGMTAGTTMQSNAGTMGMAQAMTGFLNSPMNRSGLTTQDMQSLINKLAVSNGQIQ